MAVVRYSFESFSVGQGIEDVLQIALEAPSEELMYRYGRAVKEEVQAIIRERAMEPSGELEASVYGDVYEEADGTWTATISSDAEHAPWFEEGTGLHGPRKRYITPRGARWMVFTPRGLSKKVIAFKVEGQKGQHPFRDGLNRVVGRGGPLRRM